jgi:hypothetical protein
MTLQGVRTPAIVLREPSGIVFFDSLKDSFKPALPGPQAYTTESSGSVLPLLLCFFPKGRSDLNQVGLTAVTITSGDRLWGRTCTKPARSA